MPIPEDFNVNILLCQLPDSHRSPSNHLRRGFAGQPSSNCQRVTELLKLELASRHAICHKLYTDKFQNNFLPKKSINYDKLRFPTKQRKLYFHIINIHTKGYITLNKYIIGIASIGLPKVNLWATKCVTKRP